MTGTYWHFLVIYVFIRAVCPSVLLSLRYVFVVAKEGFVGVSAVGKQLVPFVEKRVFLVDDVVFFVEANFASFCAIFAGLGFIVDVPFNFLVCYVFFF